jgi:hypothetical protein
MARSISISLTVRGLSFGRRSDNFNSANSTYSSLADSSTNLLNYKDLVLVEILLLSGRILVYFTIDITISCDRIAKESTLNQSTYCFNHKVGSKTSALKLPCTHQSEKGLRWSKSPLKRGTFGLLVPLFKAGLIHPLKQAE